MSPMSLGESEERQARVGDTTYGRVLDLLSDRKVIKANWLILRYELRTERHFQGTPIDVIQRWEAGMKRMIEIFCQALEGEMLTLEECREPVGGDRKNMTYGEYVHHWYGNGYAIFAGLFELFANKGQRFDEQNENHWRKFFSWLEDLVSGKTCIPGLERRGGVR